MFACSAANFLRKLLSLIAVKHKGFIKFCDTGKDNWFLFQHILESHENFMPHIECGLVWNRAKPSGKELCGIFGTHIAEDTLILKEYGVSQ